MDNKEAWQKIPFRDFLGQEIKKGDFLAYPSRFGTTLQIRQNIIACDGYNEGGVILRELNRITGNWVRFYPKSNYNIVKISVDGVDVTKHQPPITLRGRENPNKGKIFSE